MVDLLTGRAARVRDGAARERELSRQSVMVGRQSAARDYGSGKGFPASAGMTCAVTQTGVVPLRAL